MSNFDPYRYSRLSIALQNYLLGAKYYTALKAFDYAKKIHTGLRKDGLTPEFQHQIEIALFITTLRDVEDEEGCIVVALLHDILEDYPNISPHDLEVTIGPDNTRSIVYISKFVQGKKRTDTFDDYFYCIGKDVRASIVKGCDRVHNLRTMGNAFTLDKQKEYVKETETYFLPMLKRAAGLFPMQHLAYMNIRTMLKTQVELITATIEAYNND